MHTPAKPESLLTDLRALPRPFWVLFAGTFINRFGTFVWPFLTIYLTRSGYSLTAAATAVSAFGCGALIGSTLGGWLADRIGRRNTIVLGTFAAATFFMLLYGASTLPEILLCTALAGLANGTYHPAASALLADVVPPAQRVRAYAALRLAANAGFACGAGLGGVLANYSFLLLFVGDSLTTALYGVVALLWLPHGLRSHDRLAPWGEALTRLRGDRDFHALFAAGFFSALVFSQFGSTYSLSIIRSGLDYHAFRFHLAPETAYGLVMSWNGLLIVLAELPLTSFTLRFDPRRVMALGYVLLGGGFALNAVAHSLGMLWVAMTVFTIGEMISMPMTSAYVARIAPAHLRGRYMGALALAWNASSIVGPQIGFHAYAFAPLSVWLGCAVLGLMSAAMVLRARAIPESEGGDAIAVDA
jgi:MFS family permease